MVGLRGVHVAYRVLRRLGAVALVEAGGLGRGSWPPVEYLL